MKLKQICIRNFRSLVAITLPLDPTTVLVGENNVGKTAVLDAIRFLLSRAAAGRGALFNEYDVHLPDEKADPRVSEGISLEATFEESKPDEWPESVIQALDDVIETDPETDIDAIRLRVVCRYEPKSKVYESKAEFIHASGQPRTGRAKDPNNFQKLLRYVPVFHLSALRDADDQFSERSPFWSRILRSLALPEDRQEELQKQMEQLNQDVMKADPRVLRIRATLGKAGEVVATGKGDRVDVRALPLKVWELLARSEVVLRGRGNNAFFPLSRHGQGVQSLSVLFLFEAFVEHLLEIVYEKDSEALLTLEEPEAHLHPQAARVLWTQVTRLPGQKIITTHSPYFAQHVPIRSLRILRRRGASTTAHWLPRHAEAKIPDNPSLSTLVSKNSELYTYRKTTGTLLVKRKLTEKEWRKLLTCFSTDMAAQTQITELCQRAAALLSDDDLRKIEGYARRTRGEIFFARCWLLCEGQSEVAILPRFAEMLGLALDAKGIALIDYQNNGSPGAFAALARALDVPWFMFCDGDQGGDGHLREVQNHGFTEEELKLRTRQLPTGVDLEGFLTSSFTVELAKAAAQMGAAFNLPPSDSTFVDQELIPFLRDNKRESATLLGDALSDAGPEKVPTFFEEILRQCEKAADA